MKPNRLIQKIFAIILLFVFSQKAVVGLYLHNWLHVTNCKQSSQSTGPRVVGTSCNCVDDFSIPFAENPEKVSEIISSLEIELSAPNKFFIPLTSPLFYCLRGPPFSS